MTQPEDNPVTPPVSRVWEPNYNGRIEEAFYRTAWENGCCKYCDKKAEYYPRLDGTPSIIEIPCDCESSKKAKEAFKRKVLGHKAPEPVEYNPNAYIEPDEDKIF